MHIFAVLNQHCMTTKQIISNDRILKEFIADQHSLLLPFLLVSLPDVSRTTVKSYLTHRSVLINNTITTKHDAQLNAGDKVTITKGRGAEDFRHPMMRIVYEDDHIIVVDKRNGLLSMGTDKEREKTAFFILSKHVKKSNSRNMIFIVHRLDRETSGLMLFAKSEKVQSLLQKNWNEMVLERKYIAVIEGWLSNDEGIISARLTENKGFKMFVSNKNEGELAVTKYKVVRKSEIHSLVELELETGKKNQIRAHLEYVGNPISGDKKYGAHTSPAERVCLHAYKLHIKHPITGEDLDFSTRIPQIFESIVK